MTRLVVVGDRDSGKTTFLGLLYAAQVKAGSDLADSFRFRMAVESLDEISDVFNQLMSGGFPDSAVKEGLRGMAYQVDYKRVGGGIRSRLRSRDGSRTKSAAFDILLLRDLSREMTRFRQGGSLATVALRDLLEADAFAILVDSTKLAAFEDGRALGPMGAYDDTIASLLTTVQRSRLNGARKRFHPIFIFSKFDSVRPPALRAANLEGDPPGPKKTGPRAAYGRALLEQSMPKTTGAIRTREPRGLGFAEPAYFFSWVRTELAASGQRAKVRLRASGGGWEIDYSKDEYLALLRCLWKLAADARE